MDTPIKNKRRVKSAKRAYREYMKDPARAELFRKARSKGGKRGSKEAKSKAGKAGFTAMLESMAKKVGAPMNQQPAPQPTPGEHDVVVEAIQNEH